MNIEPFLPTPTQLMRSLRAAAHPIIGFAIGLLCVVWLAVWHQLATQREWLQRDRAKDAANLALVLEQSVARTVSEIDRSLHYVRKTYERSGHRADWPALIKGEAALADYGAQMAIIDATGMMVTSSALPYPTKPIDLSDREHFRVHQTTQQDRLFVGKPVLGRASGKWSVPFTRRLTDADGRFAGVVVFSLDAAYLSRFYGALDLGPGSGLAVVGTDGVIRAGMGINADALGRGLIEGHHLSHVAGAPDGTRLSYEMLNGQTRLVAFRAVKGFPLEVTVAAQYFEDDEGWQHNRLQLLASAALLSGLIILAAVLALRAHGRNHSQLVHLAHHDALSGLANRAKFNEALASALADHDASEQFALHLIDLDGFKPVNDTHGHLVGDTLLKVVAERLIKTVREGDLVARLGGDEFAVLQRGVTSESEAAALAQRFCTRLGELYEVAGTSVSVGASVGVCLGRGSFTDATELMKAADAALYIAKGSGRGTYRLHRPQSSREHKPITWLTDAAAAQPARPRREARF